MIPGAVLGAVLYGLIDAVSVIRADSIDPSLARAAMLAVLDGLALGVAGLGLGVGLLLLLATPAGRGVKLPVGLGVMSGLAMAFLLDLGEAWFKAPAPFTEPPPLHGNLPVFAGIALVLVVLPQLLSRLRTPAAPRVLSFVAVVGLMVSALLSGRPQVAAESWDPDGAPNVLLVTLDTTRADYFGAYGRTDVRTPHFDALAAQGVRLDNAFSQIPVTGPSHATMLSGMAPWEHGNLLNGLPIDPALPSLPRELRRHGWSTGAFVSAYVLDGALGFARGFQTYDDDFGWLQGWGETVPGRLLAMAARFTNPDHVLERRGERTVDAALTWLDDVAGDDAPAAAPFFAWVHLFDPHGPYAPPPPWDTAYYSGDPRDPAHTSMQEAENIAAYLKPSLEGITDADYVLAQYAGEISYVDRQLGRLLEWVEAAGHTEDTLVIVLADHGESLAGEHGVWFNHGDDLYEVNTWIPWAMRLPSGKHGGKAIGAPVELTDLAPTIYELVGLPAPDGVTGQSIVPALRSGVHREFARGMCFDRPTNQSLRRAGEIDKPIWRTTALRFPDHRFVAYEHESRSAEHWGIEEDGPFRTEVTAPIAIPVERELRGIADGLFASGDVSRSQTEQSQEALRKLQALGYMEE